MARRASFALGRDGRKIAAIQVSVGRAVTELLNLLNTALPGNEIRVRTVENTIILTGSVASAEEAQRALDIADGFVNDIGALHSRRFQSPSRTVPAALEAPPAARTANPPIALADA